IEQWRKTRSKPYLTIGGYAGTGKTTLICRLAEMWPDAAVVTFSGKAASVLVEKGVAKARTIHSLIYIPLRGARGKGVRFQRRHTLPGVSVIIVDEASMINDELYDHLMTFRLPVLFVGDPGQLEPIGSKFNLMCNPHITLNEIHRQARENPILGV